MYKNKKCIHYSVLNGGDFLKRCKHDHTEFIDCLEKYFYGDSRFFFFDKDKIDLDKFLSNIKKITFRDHPDGYIDFGEYVLLIEHFEFDSTKRTKDGSKTREEQWRVENEIKKRNADLYCDELKVTHSTDNLVKSFGDNFLKHINQIDDYITKMVDEKIIGTDSKVKVMFICEDISVFGCFDEDMNIVTPLDILECLETIKASVIDYIFVCSEPLNERIVFFAKNDQVFKNDKSGRSKKDIKLHDSNPNVISLKCEFKKEKS